MKVMYCSYFCVSQTSFILEKNYRTVSIYEHELNATLRYALALLIHGLARSF